MLAIQEVDESDVAPEDTVAFRLDSLEKKVDGLEMHTREGFVAISAQIAAIPFVRVEIFAAEKAALVRDIQAVREDVRDLRDDMKGLVSIEAFRPVRSIVYGAVALILMSVLGALVALVVVGQ